ncbi:MAG: transposase [Candidatus Brocadiaceae bacterium]|nr:transposase [Candidatus Brocadiaceae bacterium]
MKKPKQAKSDFDLVVENAFDFFQKSLEEFDKKPKYSVIHFHAAVELIMKARLLWEHWTLIITRPETANLKSFRSGDFQSVSIKDAKARLEAIVQEGLSQAEYECFLRLSDHRNRMVHFYHTGNTGNKSEFEKIVAEQCLAWYYVSRIFERWNEQFQSYKKGIAKIDKVMHKHRKYLKAKFGALGEDIERLKSRGILFSVCPSCGFKSFGEDSGNEPILDYECLVCKARETGLKVDCPKCGEENKLIGEPRHECSKCGHKFDEKDVQAFLTKDFVYDKHDPERSIVAHCDECGGYEMVVEVNHTWICSQCFSKYASEEVGQCEWCGSLSTGDLENSYFMGCAMCEGKSGWDSDKDD